MSDEPPMPQDFGLRYIGWVLWCNVLTILAALQAIFTAITMDPTIVDPHTFHYISIANLVLIVVLAQLKKSNPPPPAPRIKQ